MVVPTARVIVALGGFAWQALRPVLATAGYGVPRPRRPSRPAPGRRPAHPIGQSVAVLGCYHPSQQNTTFTGRVTPVMFDVIFTRAKAMSGGASP